MTRISPFCIEIFSRVSVSGHIRAKWEIFSPVLLLHGSVCVNCSSCLSIGACWHRLIIRILWTLIFFNSRMLLNYKNVCTEFYLEIQYLLTLTEKLQSHFFTETRNSDKWDSARCYSEFHWISLNFKNILQFMNLLNFERPGADFSIYACLYSLSNRHQANFTKIQQNNKTGMQWKLYIGLIIFSHDKKWTTVENTARLWQKWSLTASAVSWTFHRMQSLFTVLKLAKIATWVAYSKSAHAEQIQRYTVKQGAYYCNKKSLCC